MGGLQELFFKVLTWRLAIGIALGAVILMLVIYKLLPTFGTVTGNSFLYIPIILASVLGVMTYILFAMKSARPDRFLDSEPIQDANARKKVEVIGIVLAIASMLVLGWITDWEFSPVFFIGVIIIVAFFFLQGFKKWKPSSENIRERS